MFQRPTRPHLITAACTAACLILAAAPTPSQAARFGGGRSIGMSRSVHVSPSAPHHIESPSPAPAYRPPLVVRSQEPSAASYVPAERSNYQAIRDATMAEALLRSRFLALQRQQRARDAGMAATYSRNAPAVPYDPPEYRPLPPVEQARYADPRFSKFTPHEAPKASCEYKPVMSDEDYRACGATPPAY